MKNTTSYPFFLYIVGLMLFVNDLIMEGKIDVTWPDFFLAILASGILNAVMRYASKYQPEE